MESCKAGSGIRALAKADEHTGVHFSAQYHANIPYAALHDAAILFVIASLVLMTIFNVFSWHGVPRCWEEAEGLELIA